MELKELYDIRNHLHSIPELGFEEYKTQAYILNLLADYNQLKIHTFDFPGILVEYSYGKGKYQLFRADMDALSIEEKTDVTCKSIHQGLMHACGHDIHMTCLVGLIDKVCSENPKTNLLFLFQPAEEGRGGAQRIIDTGILNNYKISEAYALHVNGQFNLGSVACKSGIFFANSEEFDVIITGKSAHTALPQNGNDAIAGGVAFYQMIESHLNKSFNPVEPLIIHTGQINGGTVRNAVADKMILKGTIRTVNKSTHKRVHSIMKKTSAAIEKSFKVKVELNFPVFYLCVNNDKKLVNKLKKKCLNKSIEYVETEYSMTGEDFGFFADKYPSVLFWLGVNKGENDNIHSNTFFPSQESIEYGIRAFHSLIDF
ncbi:MAG: amidohydrolase [Candidatus Cloacimonetes bacterium]|nr:amidohydrolase [Candidatus Cloacimonadota bacterium]